MNKVKQLKAAGTAILLERLSKEAAAGSRLIMPGLSSEQAIISDIGPAIEKEKWGIQVGDRVLLHGTVLDVPTIIPGKNFGIVEPHMIKAVLVEEEED